MKAFLTHQASSDQSRSSAHSQRRQPLQWQDKQREGRAEATQPKPTIRFGYTLAQIPIASPDATGSRATGLSGTLRTRIERLSGLSMRKEADLSTPSSPVLPSVFDEHKTSLPVSLPIARDAQAGYERAEPPLHHFGQNAILSERQHGRPALSAIQSSAATPVIQRAGPSVKTSIPQPMDAERSSAVPDLTTLQVKQITDATSDTDRLAVIKVLAEDLVVNKGLLSTTDVPGDRKIITTDPFVEDNVCIKVAYQHGNDKLGLTYFNKDLGPNNDQLWLRMDIYEGAFSAPSILYSTIRHELIHVAQRLLQPDPHKASRQDPLMYEYKESYFDTYRRGRTAFENKYASKSAIPTESAYKTVKQEDRYRYAHHVGYMTAGSGSLQESLQEAEAHLWELEHMEETGVPAAYSLQTLNFLLAYLNQIVANINNGTTLQISYWEGYVNNITENIDTQKSAIKTRIEKWSDTTNKTGGLKIWAEVVQKAADLSTAWSSMRLIALPPTSKTPGAKKLSTSMKKTKLQKKN